MCKRGRKVSLGYDLLICYQLKYKNIKSPPSLYYAPSVEQIRNALKEI